MGKVTQLPVRGSKDYEAQLPRAVRENLEFYREHSGGDASRDDIWAGRILDAIKRMDSEKSDNEKVFILLQAMTSIVLEATGAELPVGWPFHHRVR